MKKRPDRFEKHIHETYDIGEMLQKEGKTNAERRAYQLITCTTFTREGSIKMDIQQAHAYAARELRKVESDLARALERKAPERDIANLQKKVDYRTFVAKLLEAILTELAKHGQKATDLGTHRREHEPENGRD